MTEEPDSYVPGLATRCRMEHLRQSMGIGSFLTPLSASDVEHLLQADLEGFEMPAAWRKLLALAHQLDLNESETLTQSDFDELSEWLKANKPPVDLAKAVRFDFLAAAGPDSEESDQHAADPATPPLTLVTNTERSAKQGWPAWGAYAAACSLLAVAAASGLIVKSLVEKDLRGQFEAQLGKAEQGAAEAQRQNTLAVKRNEELGAELQNLQKSEAALKQNLKTLEQSKEALRRQADDLKQTLASQRELGSGLNKDLSRGLRPNNVASGGSGLYRPSESAISETRPTLRWSGVDFEFDRVEVYDSTSKKLVWSTSAVKGRSNSVRVGIPLSRGRYYQWVLNSADPESQSLKMSFYLISSKEMQSLARSLSRASTQDQKAGVLLRFKLFDDLLNLVEKSKADQFTP